MNKEERCGAETPLLNPGPLLSRSWDGPRTPGWRQTMRERARLMTLERRNRRIDGVLRALVYDSAHGYYVREPDNVKNWGLPQTPPPPPR